MKNSLPQDIQFHARTSVAEVEEGTKLAPKFDKNGLIPVVTTDYSSGEVLMLGYMNAAAFKQTLFKREAVYYSRSRQQLWHKGQTSGFIQKVNEIRIDDDQDAIWLRVTLVGTQASCHVGYRSCFYRSVPVLASHEAPPLTPKLHFEETKKVFDPPTIYGNAPNPTQL